LGAMSVDDFLVRSMGLIESRNNWDL